MPRTLSVQVGSYANWVGAHYWSALEHKTDWDGETATLLYNEQANGAFAPRTFVVDSIESIRPLAVESTADKISTAEGFELKRIAIDSANIAQGHNWSDIWELDFLPHNRLLVPASESPSESTNRFWFESRKFTAVDMFDESGLRNLIEETDSAIATLRVLASLHDGLSGYSLNSVEYLQMAYPKASLLVLTSPLPQSADMMREESIPTVLNWMSHVCQLAETDSCLMVSPERRDIPRLASTGQEALWLDTISPSRAVARDSLSLELPYLSINDHSLFTHDQAARSGSLVNQKREGKVYINNANPICESLNTNSTIVAGTLSELSLLPRMEKATHVMNRFVKDYKPVWEQFDVEQADLYEMTEVVRTRIGEMRDQLEEHD